MLKNSNFQLNHDYHGARRASTQISQLSDPELEFLADLQSASFTLARGKELVHEGLLRQAAYVLQVGWASSSRLLPDGG